jgi:hypothetical protein
VKKDEEGRQKGRKLYLYLHYIFLKLKRCYKHFDYVMYYIASNSIHIRTKYPRGHQDAWLIRWQAGPGGEVDMLNALQSELADCKGRER